MTKALLAILLSFAACAAPASAQGLDKAWEARGFANPESVLWDRDRKVLYVSNVNGTPQDKDGNGYVSELSSDGRILSLKWATGLDGPKGMAVSHGRLFIADIDRLAVVDTATGKTIGSYAAVGAKFLSDVTADGDGNVYVSDMLGNTIWRLSGNVFEKWLSSPDLQSPNGLKAEPGRLIVASWGGAADRGVSTKTPGSLKEVDYRDKRIHAITGNLGNLDGVESDGPRGYLVSDYVKGVVFRIDARGKAKVVLRLGQGSADIGSIPEQHLLLVPMMMDGTVAAYRLP
ncbi:MAG: hypothetical protein M0006_05110 [Magnetospirillum sp.]|nr:hypothetical protein [Magnetospirillum sp.]